MYGLNEDILHSVITNISVSRINNSVSHHCALYHIIRDNHNVDWFATLDFRSFALNSGEM